MELRVRTALEEGRVEDDLKDVRMEKVVSRASSKQAMIARAKAKTEGCQATVGSSNNTRPLATRSDDEDVAGDRERGMNGSADSTDSEEAFGKRNEIVWADEDPANHRPGRVGFASGRSVRECGIESVLREGSGAFMLYYERIRFAHTSPYPSWQCVAVTRHQCFGTGDKRHEHVGGGGEDGYSPRSSEETLRPELRTLQLNMVNGMFAEGNGSTQSLVSEVGVGIANGKGKEIPKRVGTENGNGLENGVPIGTSGSLGVASMWTPGSSPPGMDQG
ncbi:Ubiquitin carboxyl-terminal hydrolase [Salix suchowensis]|nr:Ubiquitin carboxyl-terminal hydrolase [Salix suchowensis]